MYLQGCTHPSKSDFGSIASPFLTETGTALLDHSAAAARRLSEYRSYCYHEPRQQYASPWKWTLYQAKRPITSPPPSCFNLQGEAAYHEGLPSASETMFNTSKDCFLYGASGPRFHAQAFAGDPRGFSGRYTGFNPESQLLFPAGQSRILPPVFDQFSEYNTEEGVDPKAEITYGSQQEKETNPAEWTCCQSRESSEVRAGSESLQAGKEDEEDAPLSSGSGGDDGHAPSKWKSYNNLL